ncbi:hypothetical protein RAMDARK_0065, partial [Rickettsia amblyommatis str. Darkwater]
LQPRAKVLRLPRSLSVVRNDGSDIHAEMTSSIVKYTEL